MTKPIHVGEWFLGHENVRLFANPDESGGSFSFTPSDQGLPKIEVGLDHPDWDQCVAVLLHESFEFAVTRAGLRYTRNPKTTDDSGGVLFSFDHAQFSEICGAQSWFIAGAISGLHAAYQKAKRARKRKKK